MAGDEKVKKNHLKEAKFHAAAEAFHMKKIGIETAKATTPPAEDDTVKAAAEAAAKAAAAPDPMAAIYARQSANHEAVEKLAARVPATATRAALETLYARVGANGQTR